VTQYVVLAVPTHQLIGRVSGELFGAFIPILNAPFPVYKVDTVAHLIEQLTIKTGIVDGALDVGFTGLGGLFHFYLKYLTTLGSYTNVIWITKRRKSARFADPDLPVKLKV
jgi:hypothetical protein